jgi:hypothetical protein
MRTEAREKEGWYGVDLDGTLARYDDWIDAEWIGPPIIPMIDRVKSWLEEGRDVRIFTARACDIDNPFRDKAVSAIKRWTVEQFGVELQVTCIKDRHMKELWDDRAVQILVNTGLRADGKD